MYQNLKAEMARKGIRKSDLADVLGVSRQTIRTKMKREDLFKLCEALKIQEKLFPDSTIEYLFKQ